MRLDLQAELFRRYPRVFRKPGPRLIREPVTTTVDLIFPGSVITLQITPPVEGFEEYLVDDRGPIDAWGIECGDGWYQLIDRLAHDLENEIEIMVTKDDAPKTMWPRIAQVKEKFGCLRFYVHGELTDDMRARIRAAQDESAHVCENCGGTGEEYRDGWVRVLCPACQTDRLRKRHEPFDFDAHRAAVKAVLDSRAE
jgi:hypothetical protein